MKATFLQQMAILPLLMAVVCYAHALGVGTAIDNSEVAASALSSSITIDQSKRSLAQTPTVSPSTTAVHHDDHVSSVTHAPSSHSSTGETTTTTTATGHDDGEGHSGTDDTHSGVTTHHTSDSAHGEVHHSSVFGIITGRCSCVSFYCDYFSFRCYSIPIVIYSPFVD